jgi:hypothetical protein
MNTRELIERIEKIFGDKLNEKTNWGRNQILSILKDSISEALLESLPIKNST